MNEVRKAQKLKADSRDDSGIDVDGQGDWPCKPSRSSAVAVGLASQLVYRVGDPPQSVAERPDPSKEVFLALLLAEAGEQ